MIVVKNMNRIIEQEENIGLRPHFSFHFSFIFRFIFRFSTFERRAV